MVHTSSILSGTEEVISMKTCQSDIYRTHKMLDSNAIGNLMDGVTFGSILLGVVYILFSIFTFYVQVMEDQGDAEKTKTAERHFTDEVLKRKINTGEDIFGRSKNYFVINYFIL